MIEIIQEMEGQIKRLFYKVRGKRKKKNFIERLQYIIEHALSCESGVLLYIVSSFALIILAVHRTTVSVLLSIVGSIYLFFRYRYRKMKKYEGIVVNSKNVSFKQNQIIQANNIGDVVMILLYALCGLTFVEFGNDFWFEIIAIMLFLGCIFFAFAYCSIRKNCWWLKIFTILASTIQGTIILAFLLVGVLMVIEWKVLLPGSNMVIFTSDTIADVQLEIVEITMILALLLEKYPIVIIIEIAISSFFLVIYVRMTPPYQLNKLQTAFQFVNIIMVLISITALISSNNIADFINVGKDKFVNTEFYQDILLLKNGKEYWDSFGSSNIGTLFSIVVLPYTFAQLIVNIVFQKRREHMKKETDDILEELMTGNNVGKNDLLEMQKKYYFYDGERLFWELYYKEYCRSNSKH